VKRALALAAAIAAASSASANPPQRYDGGPWDGLLPDAQTLAPAGASLPDASPVPAQIAPVIDKLVAALSRGDKAALQRLGPGGQSFCLNEAGQPCGAPEETAHLPVQKSCKINTPFFMARYDRSVRLEWVCAGRLSFLAFAKIENGELVSLMPMSSMPPVPVIKLPAKKNG